VRLSCAFIEACTSSWRPSSRRTTRTCRGLSAADYDFCRSPALPLSARVVAVLQRVGDEAPGSDRVPDPEREARETHDRCQASKASDNAR
jgi:hypothetical protein